MYGNKRDFFAGLFLLKNNKQITHEKKIYLGAHESWKQQKSHKKFPRKKFSQLVEEWVRCWWGKIKRGYEIKEK